MSDRPIDSYGRTIHDLLAIYRQQGIDLEDACMNPDCPDWTLSYPDSNGRRLWFEHHHPTSAQP